MTSRRWPIILFLSLLSTFGVAAAEADANKFIRVLGLYSLEGGVSSVEIKNEGDGTFTVSVEWKTKSTNSISTNSSSFTVEKLEEGRWFVFVESPSRVWFCDGRKSLMLAEHEEGTVRIQDYDVRVKVTCPKAVVKALLEEVRRRVARGAK